MNNKALPLSVVIPCFNEEETILPSYDILSALCKTWLHEGLITQYELLFVNDGSHDGTLDILISLHTKDPRVTVIDLRKNVGFQGAITAGLFSASGDMVVSIDADLQDDPKQIQEMIVKHYEGYPMVLGVRKDRTADSFFKRLFAQKYYWFLKKLGVTSVHNHADFRLLGRDVIRELAKFPERVRYLRALIFEVEPRYACVYYARTKRKYGTSKFTFLKSLSLAVDGVTSFTDKPIRLVSLIGIFMFFSSFVASAIVLGAKLYWHVAIPGWASLAVIVLFFGGIQNLCLGIIGGYIASIYMESKQRPLYSVRNEYRHAPQQK